MYHSVAYGENRAWLTSECNSFGNSLSAKTSTIQCAGIVTTEYMRFISNKLSGLFPAYKKKTNAPGNEVTYQ